MFLKRKAYLISQIFNGSVPKILVYILPGVNTGMVVETALSVGAALAVEKVSCLAVVFQSFYLVRWQISYVLLGYCAYRVYLNKNSTIMDYSKVTKSEGGMLSQISELDS